MPKAIQFSFAHTADMTMLSLETEKALRAQAKEYGLQVESLALGKYRVTGKGADITTTISQSMLDVTGFVGMPASMFFDKIRKGIETETPERIRQCETMAKTASVAEVSKRDMTPAQRSSEPKAMVPIENVPEVHWRRLDPTKSKRYSKDYRAGRDPTPGEGLEFVVDLNTDDYGRFLRIAALVDVHMLEFAESLNATLRRPTAMRAELARLQARIGELEEGIANPPQSIPYPATLVPESPSLPASQPDSRLSPPAGVQEIRRLWLAFGGLTLFVCGVLFAALVR